jgi:DNA-binding transcriptional regulator/RsmH inhibitor MraZ
LPVGVFPEYWLNAVEEWDSRKTKKLQKFYLDAAYELRLDKRGRVLIPRLLREFAGLKRNVMLVSLEICVNRFQLWDRGFMTIIRPGESWESRWMKPF